MAILLPLLSAGLTAAGVIGAINSAGSSNTYDSYLKYQDALKQNGFDNSDMRNILDDLYSGHNISYLQYKDAMNTIDRANKAYGNGLGWDDWWYNASTSAKTHKQNKELYDMLAENIPKLNYNNANTKDIMNTLNGILQGSMPAISGPAAPSYEDTSFGNYQREVDPVKLWTGKELADLHGIDFDPDIYYDLIKKGAEAEVSLQEFKNAISNDTSMKQDSNKVNTYLSSIRNNKSQAIADGATAGQRAANELLSNISALSDYSTEQKEIADASLKGIEDATLKNAQAKITANDFYTNIAKSLAKDSAALYENDTYRYGQDMLSNAEFYTADEALRGARAVANANMYADYVAAAANVNAARSSMQSKTDEYSWVFNNFLRSNNGSFKDAYGDFNKYLTAQFTGQNSIDNLYKYLNK